jgi:hypothetical protein
VTEWQLDPLDGLDAAGGESGVEDGDRRGNGLGADAVAEQDTQPVPVRLRAAGHQELLPCRVGVARLLP